MLEFLRRGLSANLVGQPPDDKVLNIGEFSDRSTELAGKSLDEEFFFVLERIVAGAWVWAPAGAQEIEAYFQAGDYGGNFLHGLPDGAAELGACVFDRFEGAGDQAIDGDQLPAQAVGRFGEDAIHFLRLRSGEVDDVGGIGDQFGNFRLSIVKDELNAGENRRYARLHVGGERFQARHGALHLKK
jgi:hypothetical protein